jgi:hypothetical protein
MSREKRESLRTELKCPETSGNLQRRRPMLGDGAPMSAENSEFLWRIADVEGEKRMSADGAGKSPDIRECLGRIAEVWRHRAKSAENSKCLRRISDVEGRWRKSADGAGKSPDIRGCLGRIANVWRHRAKVRGETRMSPENRRRRGRKANVGRHLEKVGRHWEISADILEISREIGLRQGTSFPRALRRDAAASRAVSTVSWSCREASRKRERAARASRWTS